MSVLLLQTCEKWCLIGLGDFQVKCLEVDLSQILKVNRLGFSHQTTSGRHVTRYTSEYIVYAVESGRLLLLHNGQEIELLPGDIYIFNKGEYQRPLENTACDFHFLHFDTNSAEWLDLSPEEFCNRVKFRKAEYLKSDLFSTDGYNHIKALIHQKIHINDRDVFEYILDFFKSSTLTHNGNDPLKRLTVSFVAAEVLTKLEQLSFDEVFGSNRKKSRAFGTAERIADFIAKNYKQNFSSDDLEKALFINYDYANRLFRQHFGYSIIQYRNRLRINTAKTLVDSMQLDEVAYSVGFSDRYYFSKCFKKHEGISPEEYRSRNAR